MSPSAVRFSKKSDLFILDSRPGKVATCNILPYVDHRTVIKM